MFGDDDDLTNEEILELMKTDPPGLKAFGEDWRKEMDMHPLFMDKIPDEVIDGTFDRTKWPVLASHLDMMYDDEDDLEGCALNYKEDGNTHFKKGTKRDFYLAIISYTEGINKKCSDNNLNAVLYGNRAAAQFNIGNYRKATQDCEEAIRHDPKYMKAVIRAVKAQQKLGNIREALEWCDRGLAIDKHHAELISTKVKSLQKLKVEERNERKRMAMELRERKANAALLSAIKSRGIRIYVPEMAEAEAETEEERNQLILDSLRASSCGTVSLNVDNDLVWPVRLLYPEYSTSDLISEFCERNSLLDHLSYMFPPEGTSPEWDEDGSYQVDKLVVCITSTSSSSGCKLVEVNQKAPLAEVLVHGEGMLVSGGVVTFEVYVRNSETHMSHILGT